ncbi:hypothetical protein HD806DRAFT_533008 [Xylariaceae sp. AK1471]|nr:hypothetical protein HD806DRAFT_533008 [Xylariaceae sp. AK1471]
MEPLRYSVILENNEQLPPRLPSPPFAEYRKIDISGLDSRSPKKWFYISIAALLSGSIGLIFLGKVVEGRHSDWVRLYTNSLNPSCTDVGNNPAEQIFALDLAFGNFTFTQAKIIDATWDTVIGQGGRLLHGWILYQFIIYPLLILTMETSTASYAYYNALSFSKASFDTLLEVIKAVRTTRSYSVIMCTLLLIYTLGYTLFFALLWSAATGYISLSHKLYAMPGGEVVPLNTEDLALCWVLDHTRLGLSGSHVEIGPNFSAILAPGSSSEHSTSHSSGTIVSGRSYGNERHDLLYSSGGWRVSSAANNIWDSVNILDVLEERFEEFNNIRRYALTRQFLQIGLNSSHWIDAGTKTNIEGTSVENTTIVDLGWWYNTSLVGLYSSIRAVQLESLRMNSSTQGSSNFVDRRPYNESKFEAAYWSNFILNESVPLKAGIVPYNSTLQFKGSSIAIAAPFLDIGMNCAGNSIFTSLGNCVCYKGQPIPFDLLSDKKAICNTAPGYVWGFSSSLTYLGLILEAVWMACCFISYPWLSLRSKLLGVEPIKSAKTMRLLLDCSESVCNDIGLVAKELPEEELAERLKNTRIGYQAEVRDGKLRYRITSGLTSKGFSQRLDDADAELSMKLDLFDAKVSKELEPIEAKLFKCLGCVEVQTSKAVDIADKVISNGAQRVERTLNKTVPILNRVDEHFHPINKLIDPIHDAMNSRFDEAIAALRSQIQLKNGRRKPTASEVYEDLNWRFERH